MTATIAYDLTRLFVGPVVPTPRGIDRVDLAYAAHFVERWPGDCVATLPTPWGVRALSRGSASRLIKTVANTWGETAVAGEDVAYGFVKARLSGKVPSGRAAPHRPARAARRIVGGILRSLRESGGLLGTGSVKVPAGAVYLNTGQLGLSSRRMISWLKQRPDVKPVFMLHDTIPLDYPQYVTPFAKRLHANMIANTAKYARGLIVTTDAVRISVMREIERCGGKDIPIAAARLPVDSAFLREEDPDPELAGRRYFVVCGSIEPRKNHRLLLDVWSQLVADEGVAAPKLVIVGTPWRDAGKVIGAAQSDLLSNSVIAVSGLTTPALCRLLSGARALLMPSLAEGFGLPIVEALARGIPAIASDLPAHRETGGAFVTYVDPRDAAAWLAAVRAHAHAAPCGNPALSDYRAWTWSDYARCIEPFVESVWRGER